MFWTQWCRLHSNQPSLFFQTRFLNQSGYWWLTKSINQCHVLNFPRLSCQGNFLALLGTKAKLIWRMLLVLLTWQLRISATHLKLIYDLMSLGSLVNRTKIASELYCLPTVMTSSIFQLEELSEKTHMCRHLLSGEWKNSLCFDSINVRVPGPLPCKWLVSTLYSG